MAIIYNKTIEILKKHYFNLLYCVLISQLSAFLLLNILGQGFSDFNIRSVVFYIIVFFLQAGLSLGVMKCCLLIIDKDSFDPFEIFKQFDFLFSYISSAAIITMFGILVFSPAIISIYNNHFLEITLQEPSNIFNAIEQIMATLGLADLLLFSGTSILFIYISLRLFFAPYFIIDHPSSPSGWVAILMSFSYTQGKTIQVLPMFFIILIFGYFPNILTFFLLPTTIILPALFYRYLNKL